MATSDSLLHPSFQFDLWLKPHLSSSISLGYPIRLKGSREKRNHLGINFYSRLKSSPPRRTIVKRLDCLSTDDSNGPLFHDNSDKLNPSISEVISSEKIAAAAAKSEKALRIKADSIEDEAWELLNESIVYYCANPVGTIAANDPTSTSILNYDQVFIRDFIPSAIAFLLKGEYDIVRNFILHTLQLQVTRNLFHPSFFINILLFEDGND